MSAGSSIKTCSVANAAGRNLREEYWSSGWWCGQLCWWGGWGVTTSRVSGGGGRLQALFLGVIDGAEEVLLVGVVEVLGVVREVVLVMEVVVVVVVKKGGNSRGERKAVVD